MYVLKLMQVLKEWAKAFPCKEYVVPVLLFLFLSCLELENVDLRM